MKSSVRSVEILKENGNKKKGINLSETILTLLLIAAFFVSTRDLMYSELCLAVALLTGGVVVLAYQISGAYMEKPDRIRKGIYIGSLALFVVSILFLIQGFLYTVDRFLLLWNARFETEWTQFATGSMAGIGSVILWGLLAVSVSSFLLGHVKKQSMWGPILLATMAGAFDVILGQTSTWIGMFFLVAGLVGIFVLYSAPERKFGLNGVSYLLTIGGILAVLVMTTGSYESLKGIEQGKKQIEEQFEKFRYGEDTLPHGEFGKANKLLDGEEDTLQLKLDTPQELYLRGFVGADYGKSGWKKLSSEQYQGEYDGMFSWLENQEFSVMTQYSDYALLDAEHENTDLVTSEVQVKNVGAYRKYVYLPSVTESWNGKRTKSEKDSQVQSSGFFGTSAYTFQVVDDAPTAENAYPASWTENASDAQETQYLDAESVYHSFVEDSYMTVDEEEKTLIESVFFSDLEEAVDFNDVTTRIRQTLRANTQYTKTPDTMPYGENFVKWFLEDYKKGNAVSYASTAVLAYRVAGYPARYVEGYHLSTADAQRMEENNMTEITLTTQNAHAWVEVYVNGMGWLPVEVVPGMYVETYTNQKVEGKPAYTVNPSKQDDGVRTDEEGKDGLNDHLTDKKEEQLDWSGKLLAAIILSLYVCLFIYFVLELQRYLRRLYRHCGEQKLISQEMRVSKYVSHMEYLFKAANVRGDISYPKGLEEEIQRKLPTVPVAAYRRVVELIQKSRFGGRELKPYEKHTLRAFEQRLHLAVYRKQKIYRKLLLRYWYAV